ncbi:MAG: MATE family efflux transporter [Bacteroidales bacterium]|jgi:putative MATE family efflux protein|nr:MATE family efflux transporter [Bacteroidales bacterium]
MIEKLNRINLRKRDIFKSIVDSVKGSNVDYTKISIKKALFLLSIPMVLEMLMESVFAIVDIYFVSRLGSEAIAAVGITESIITLVYAVGIGLSLGTSAMVSRRIGEKNQEKASGTAFHGIVAGVIFSSLIAIPGIFFAKDILQLMGASSVIVNEHSSFTSIMLGGNYVILLLFVINGIFRSAGNAAIALRVLALANVINIVLDPCLIFGIGPFPELGVQGAAIATNIGRGVAVVYQLYLLVKGSGAIKIDLSRVKLSVALMGKLVRLSIGSIGQILIMTTSWLALVRVISTFGSDALSGYTIGIRVIIFAILPCNGLSNAVATLVGQNLGASRPDRSEESVWLAVRVNAVILILISIILIAFTEPLIRIFTDNIRVIKSGVDCLRIVSYGFVVFGFGSILINSLNGAGDTKTPTIINIFCFWCLEIPLACFLAFYTGMNENGVFYSIIISEAVMTLIALYVFRLGKWKYKEV